MQVLVTRPEPQASAWTQALREAGLAAHALPLIDIAAPPEPQRVTRLWQALPEYRALMFVSPASVSWFFKQRPPHTPWPDTLLAACPGPGTAKQLAAHSENGPHAPSIICPAANSPQFDSEHLWPLLAPLHWQGQRVAIVSGGDATEARGRTWLTHQWQAAGAHVDTIVTYQRGASQWRPEQAQLAQDALSHPARYTWLFSSSEALAHLAAWVQNAQAPWAAHWPELRALVTHPRIAENARALGLRHITETRPDLGEVVAALRSAL